jgi:hypothetical protein
MFYDIKGVIRSRKSKKGRQYNGQKEEGQTIQWAKEEGQTTQWTKRTKQKNKQRSTEHYTGTRDRATQTSLNTEGELRFSGRVSSSCST